MGSYAPDGVLTNADLERLVDTSDRWIMERTGVRERRKVDEGETASVLGAEAARRALDAAGNPPVDAILVATSSPDTLFPSTACLVQRRLGLGGTSMAMDVTAACTGFIYGLQLADSMVRAGTAQRVLVIAAEAMTTLIDYKDRSTCVLFGDGAGAAVVGASGNGHGILATRTLADGELSDIIYYGPGEDPGQQEDRVRMAGRGTFRVAVERMSEVAVQLCEDVGWSLDDVTYVVPHQANLRIVEAIAKRLSMPMDRVVYNGDRFGNTSAASIPLALDEVHRAGLLQPGDRLLCLAFGAGATWGGVAMEWALDAPR
jgi:3-oxoacyl-[acyl-carrier-protein] synthase-3